MAPPDEGVPTATRQPRLVRRADAEPLPGYRLIEPLGSGGFGEVWKCEAPGGLFKAIKFVGGDPTTGRALAAQEKDAVQRIKSIRHPFLLSLERVEEVDGVLILVTELADRNLQSVLLECQAQGLPGVPRDQVLAFMGEAAEALDVINFKHGLQHLDVKPHNLFLVSNHIKVADFGLVHRLPGSNTPATALCGGATPLYASPESLQGSLSRHSDQYSLAIVYQQLLTGTVPFWSANPYQLLMQHIAGSPDLSALPAADRPLVDRALAKTPEQRFPSCTEFVQALRNVAAAPPVRLAARDAAAEAALVAAAGPTRLLSPMPLPNQATVFSAGNPPWPPPGATALAPAPMQRTAPPLPARTPSISGEGPAHAPQSGLSLPGHRFLTCVGRTALGCLWTVQDPAGRERLAHCLLNVGEVAPENLARLETLRHAAVPEREVFWSPRGCLVLVADMGAPTLRDRFDQCRSEGLPGVPRQALLDILASAAAALDDLYRAEKISHLGLNPAQLVLEGDRVRLGDFGLASLLWLPAGKPAAPLNPRYTAPELFDPAPSLTADQFSLALIYTEMLTGVYPRMKLVGGKSGQHRRPGSPDIGSGQHRRPTLPEAGSGQHRRPSSFNRAAGAARADLDFLSPADRPVVARALHEDPAERYSTCTAFIEALQAATPAAVVTEEMLASLPLVVPFACLKGEGAPAGTPTPMPDEVAAELIAASVGGAVHVREADNARYIIHADGAWEYRFPIRIVAGLMRPKLEGFRQQWDARSVEDGPESFAFEIQTGVGRAGFWPLSKVQPSGLAVRLRLRPPGAPDTNQREAVVRVGLYGEHGPRRDTLLPATAPRLFQSLRAYLQGGADQRQRERWPFTQRVGLYPVLTQLEIGKAMQGRGRDVSLGGVRLLVPEEPPSEFAYMHFHETPSVAPLAVLGRIVRVMRLYDGGFELGVSIAMAGPPGA